VCPHNTWSQSEPLSALNHALEQVVKKIAPVVVKIDITAAAQSGDDQDLQHTRTSRTQSKLEHAVGSGVIVDSHGYIITNAHVVRGAARVKVTFHKSVRAGPEHATAIARVLGEFDEGDLALIKVDVNGLPSIPLSSRSELREGEIVIAVGSPEGLQNTVSIGVVSSVARQVTPDAHLSYIQTDAAINPGSSGGPLVDIKGNLVGINAFFLSQGGGSEGLGFAIPSRFVQFAYANILQNGKVVWGDAGLRVQDITEPLAEGLHLPRQSGVLVSDVAPGTSAELAGVKTRDVIVALDGKPLDDVAEYFEMMYHKRAGDKLGLGVVRDSGSFNFDLSLTDTTDVVQETNEPPIPQVNPIPKLGVFCSELASRSHFEMANLRSHSGVVVEARTAGEDLTSRLIAGDIIRSVNLVSVSSVTELQSVLDNVKPDTPIVLQVERKGQFIYVPIDD